MASSKRSGSGSRGRGSGSGGGRVTPKKGAPSREAPATRGRRPQATEKAEAKTRARARTEAAMPRARTRKRSSATTRGDVDPDADADGADVDGADADGADADGAGEPAEARGWRRFVGPSSRGAAAGADEEVDRATEVPEDDEIGPDGLRVPRWGLGDVAIGFAAAIVLGALAPALLLPLFGYAAGAASGLGAAIGTAVGQAGTGQPVAVDPGFGDAPLWLQTLIQIPFWSAFLGVSLWAVIRKGNGPVADLGLRIDWRRDLPVGVAVGVATQLVGVFLVYKLLFLIIPEQDVSAGARQLTDRATDAWGLLFLFLIVGVFAPITEEIYFRGLTQGATVRKWGVIWGVGTTSVFFAITHFNPLELPALVVFGLILGFMRQRTGRLGGPLVAHVAFNLTAATLLAFNLMG